MFGGLNPPQILVFALLCVGCVTVRVRYWCFMCHVSPLWEHCMPSNRPLRLAAWQEELSNIFSHSTGLPSPFEIHRTLGFEDSYSGL
jgi:hypothetical protein